MRTVNFLQQARQFTDYIVQTSFELPQPESYPRHELSDVQRKKRPASQWTGQDRRAQLERRSLDRRNERQSAMLDTRVGMDRRRGSRRQTDELELRSFSCRV